MAIRKPTDADHERISSFLKDGWGGEWPTSSVESRLAESGTHRFDDAGAYCHVTANDLYDPPGTMPTGPCSMIATLSPLRPQRRMTRAQYEQWARDTLTPLVRATLREFAKDNSRLLQRPLYSIGARTLVPYWKALFDATVEPYGDKTYVLWTPKLRTALDRL